MRHCHLLLPLGQNFLVGPLAFPRATPPMLLLAGRTHVMQWNFADRPRLRSRMHCSHWPDPDPRIQRRFARCWRCLRALAHPFATAWRGYARRARFEPRQGTVQQAASPNDIPQRHALWPQQMLPKSLAPPTLWQAPGPQQTHQWYHRYGKRFRRSPGK